MDKKPTPEDLQSSDAYELLTEVSHDHLREFVVDLVTKGKSIIRIYSVYQVIMMLVFVFFLTRGIVFAIKGNFDLLLYTIMAVIFSVTALIVIHELIHALAYLVVGARRISFGTVLKKFIFYAIADRQVINSRAFHLVALAPFVTVKLVCMMGILEYYTHPLVFFFMGVMSLHSLFCAGDIAMLAFYKLHEGKEIFNFDDKSKGKTYFYARKN
ncbi:MAG TPA: DUF3267 domain-containing protein [Prolixibacteraceae bacterium]|nr:DUF3267 domain-containing protein [Prolixibacteraceae bacterium]